MSRLRKSIVLLLILNSFLSSAAERPDTLTIQRRTAAYSTDQPENLKGYFPAGAELTILGTEGAYVRVRFVSPSDKTVEALCRSLDLGLPSSPAPVPTVSSSPRNEKPGAEDLVEISADQFDSSLLSPLARKALDMDIFDWRHAQTEHFVIHYEHGIFARKVARLAEFYYHYISQDLQGPADRMKGRSHILIFRKTEDWQQFMNEAGPGNMAWAFAFVSGPVMFLQQADNTSSSAGILAHEMTHLVLNRFFRTSPPTWLNEGLAEWYGEFAYSAFKGTKKSVRIVFQPIDTIVPVDLLLRSKGYPETPEAIHLFYQSSKYLVGFLRSDHQESLFIDLMRDVLNGKPVWPGIQSRYGYNSPEELSQAFQSFAHFQ